MKLVLAETSYLKDSISIISDLVNEASFKIGPNSVELVAMDPANVAMVIYKLLSSCFTEYNVKEEMNLAINLSNLKQILRRTNPEDVLIIELAKDNRLQIQLKGRSTRTFSIPIIELEEKEQKVPELNFGATAKLPCNIFNEAIEDADIVAESVSFECEDKKFTVIAEGDLSKAKIEIKEDDNVKIASESKVRSKYSLEYLKKMIGGCKLADEVIVQFSKDYPLKLDYKTVDKVLLSFILAPRVEND
jgi:proliferating cell nuclear antigen